MKWLSKLLGQTGSKEMGGDDWPFSQPENQVALVTAPVLEGKEPVLYVSHDEDDGVWQFIGRSSATEENGRGVSMKQVVKTDGSLKELAGLQPGEVAESRDVSEAWKIKSRSWKSGFLGRIAYGGLRRRIRKLDRHIMKMTSPLLAAAAACVVVASSLRAADEKTAPAPAKPPATETPATPPAEEKLKADEKPAADFSKLDKTIAYAVSALEKKDFEGFFKNLTDPETLKDMADQGHPVETLVKQVDAEVARQLLDAFHAVKDVKPKMENEGNKATYTIPEDVVMEKKLRAGALVFERIENHWYLTN